MRSRAQNSAAFRPGQLKVQTALAAWRNRRLKPKSDTADAFTFFQNRILDFSLSQLAIKATVRTKKLTAGHREVKH